MNKRFASLLIPASTMSIASMADAASEEAKASTTGTKEIATAEYKLAREKCDATAGLQAL